MSERNKKTSITSDEADEINMKDGANVNVNNTIDKFTKQMEKQKRLLKEISNSFNHMSDSFDDFKKELNDLKRENKALKKEVSRLNERCTHVEQKMQAVERNLLTGKQNSNCNHMVITNLPKLTADTDLKVVVTRIANQIGYTIAPNEILDTYQIVNESKKMFPVVVKLNSITFKKECMKFRKNKKTIDLYKISPNLKNDNKNINFFHYLEKEYAILLNKAKDIAKQKKYKFVWYANSSILVRKSESERIIRINTEDDIKKLV